MIWAVALWWNVGSDRAPYLVPADAVRSMGHVDPAVRQVLVLHTLRHEVNEALGAALYEQTRRRELLGLLNEGDEP